MNAPASPYDLFLSHSAKDKAVVRPLPVAASRESAAVPSAGQTPPREMSGALTRRRHRAKIEAGLEHSRAVPLAHWMGEGSGVRTANAFGSDWAQLEAGTFRFRDPLNQERRFLPLRLDDAPTKGSLAQFLYINWLPADCEQ
jgi:hypothetical protein